MTMVALQVNFDLDYNTIEDRAETEARAKRHIEELPGLVWKLWLRDPASKRAGGIYLFKDRQSAEAWGNSRLETMHERMPWASNITWEYFGVDEGLSRITKALPERL